MFTLPKSERLKGKATISAGLMPGKTVGDGVEEMRRIAKTVIPDSLNIQTELTGTSKEYEESSSGLYESRRKDSYASEICSRLLVEPLLGIYR